MDEKELKKQVREIFNKREVPTELYRAISNIHWLHELDAADIEEAVKFMWAFATINHYKMNRETFDYMINQIEYALLHPMEKMSPGIVTEEETKLRCKAIELLINIVCEVGMGDNIFIVIPANDVVERIQQYKENPKYKDMFTYKSTEDIFFKKYLEQYKAGVAAEDIKVDLDECEKEYELNLNKIRDKDKRVKYRDIDMIDAETKEVVHTFKDREECIEATGISKSRLSQILASCKIYHGGIYAYNGWQSWKDKDSGKYYHFREKYKTD